MADGGGDEGWWWLTIRRQVRETERAYELMRSVEEELRRSRQLEDPIKRATLLEASGPSPDLIFGGSDVYRTEAS